MEGSWCPDVVFCLSLLLRGRMRLHALMLMVVVGMLYDRPVYARHREGASYHNSHPVHHNERNEEIHDQMRWVHEIRARVDSGEIQDGYKITKSGILYKLFGDESEDGKKVEEGDTVRTLYKMYLLHAQHHIHSMSHPDKPVEVEIKGEYVHLHFHAKTGHQEYVSTSKNSHVIKGFEEALELMRYGQRGHFNVPPELAFGQNGSRSKGVPPHAHIELYIEVLPQLDQGSQNEL